MAKHVIYYIDYQINKQKNKLILKRCKTKDLLGFLVFY